MAQYVVHKLGFFYTDESFVSEDGYTGSIVAKFSSLEEARQAKESADIKSLQGCRGMNAVDFFFGDGSATEMDAIYEQLVSYYQTEYGQTIDDYYFLLPSDMSQSQARKLLTIMNLTFHTIVEYADDDVLHEKDFGPAFDEEIGEF